MDRPWYSSFGSDFNYDFHVTLDETVAPVEYNYTDKATLVQKGESYFTHGESHGVSVFLRDGDRVFHTYSAYARGADLLVGTYNYLDLTALGRQEDWEEPRGRSDSPFMGWLRRHDEYDGIPAHPTEEARVLDVIEGLMAAVRAKDVERVVSRYAADVVTFDLAPPLQYAGREELRKSLADWFSTFEGPVGYASHGLRISVGGDVAFGRSLNHLSGKRTDGTNTDVWVRVTVGCRRVGGTWLIVHEHTSVPFYMDGSEKAATDLEPRAAE
jgi:ketosteroid isomerase-like protein